MRNTSGKLLVVVIAAISLQAYASSSGVFTDYRETFHQAKAAFAPGNYSEAEKVFAKDAKKENGAALLANLELAGLYQAGGDFAKSKDCLLRVADISKEMEGRAKTSGRNILRTAASTVTSDRALEFAGESFEKVMARSMNALNFLMLGDLVGAGVEVKQAEEYQKLERDRHEKELVANEAAAAEETKEQKAERAAGENAYATSNELATEYNKIALYTKGFENPYQNPFTHFLSGLIYELGGRPDEKDDARIEYQMASKLWPASKANKEMLAPATEMSKNPSLGRVVVIYGAGLIAEKQEIKFPVSVPPKGTQAWVAFATYADYTPLSERLVIRSGPKKATSDPIVNLRVFAVKALQNKWKGTAIRQAARIIVKTAASEATKAEGDDGKKEKKGGLLGGLLGRGGEVYNAASEGADLRAWYSLPDQLQAAVLYLPAGDHQLELTRTTVASAVTSTPITVAAGRTTVVYARGFDNYLGAWARIVDSGSGAQAMGAAGREMTVSNTIADPAKPAGDSAVRATGRKPKIVIEESVKYFGTVGSPWPAGQEIKHRFTVRNTGKADLIVTATPSCGCTIASFDKIIMPDESGSVSVVIDTTKFNGSISKTITVATNDPDTPQSILYIKGIVKPVAMPSDAAKPAGEAPTPTAPRAPGASSLDAGGENPRDDVEIVRRKAERLDSGFLSGFLIVQVTIRGNRRGINRYESMFEWFDAAGRKIDEKASAWTPGQIGGEAEEDLQAVAPGKAAASCRFHIRSPAPSAPEPEMSAVSRLRP